MKKLPKIFKSAGRVILMLIYALVVIVVVAFVGVCLVRDIHVSKALIDEAISKFAPDDIKIQVDEIDLHLLRERFWQKRITLVIKGACVSYQEPAVHVCFNDLDVQVSINYKWFKIAIADISPVHLLGAEAAVDLDAFKPSPEPSTPSSFSFIDFARKDLLPHWKFAGSQISLKSARIKSGKDLYGFKAFMGANDGEIHLIIPDARDLKSDALKADLALLAYLPGDLTTANAQPWKVQIGGNLKAIDKQAKIDLHADIRSFDDVTYALTAKIRNLSVLRELKLNGTYKKDDVRGVVSMQLGAYGAGIKQLNFVNCGYDAHLDKKTAQLECGPQAILLTMNEDPAFRNAPELFRIRPALAVKLTDISFAKGIKGKADVKIDLSHIKLIDAHFHASANYDGSQKKTMYSVKVEAGADILKFKRLVKLLRQTPYAVPAPLNVMKGHISFGLHGELNQDGGEFPFEFSPDLHSETQRLLLTVGGSVKLKPSESGFHTHVEVDTAIQAMNLAVPRLDLAALPQLSPDSRFTTPTPTPKPLTKAAAEDAAKKKERIAQESKASLAKMGGVGERPLNATPTPQSKNLSYKAKLHTTSPGAIQLQTNLTKNNIPISIDLIANSRHDALVGTVDIGHTAVELFHRKAEVQDISLKLRPDGTQYVDAKLVIHYLDYTIFVIAEGGTSDPNIRLESDPPLEQADIISVLLYGRTADDLDPGQSQSVSSTNSAIADKAIGIASLFLLASTPIESVAYDSQTHSVTARIGLGKGTSLDVGSGSQVVGVKHRLGKHWILSTYVEKDQVTQENAVDAFVEWVKLF